MNLLQYFEDKGIAVSLTGNNVGKNFVGIRCIYPECTDTSNHLGVHKQKLFHSCLKCGNKGNIFKMISMIEGCSYNEAKEIVKSYGGTVYFAQEERPLLERALVLPKSCRTLTRGKFPKAIYNYLMGRRFDPFKIAFRYGLMTGGTTGFFKNRLVVPFFMNNEIVSALGSDIFGSSKIKYKNLPNEPDENGICGRYSVKDLVYNIDSANSIAVVVEGVTDVWRLGDGAMAVAGVGFTSSQIEAIIARGFEKVFILFDSEPLAQARAEVLATELLMLGQNVEILNLNEGDPADLSQRDADEIMLELMGERNG